MRCWVSGYKCWGALSKGLTPLASHAIISVSPEQSSIPLHSAPLDSTHLERETSERRSARHGLSARCHGMRHSLSTPYHPLQSAPAVPSNAAASLHCETALTDTWKMLARDEFVGLDVERPLRACHATRVEHSSRGFARRCAREAATLHKSTCSPRGLRRASRSGSHMVRTSQDVEDERERLSKIRARLSTLNCLSYKAITGSDRRRRSVRPSGVRPNCPRSARLDPVMGGHAPSPQEGRGPSPAPGTPI